jgi:hypothetical protein
MGQPVAITNFEHSAADLRRFASREKSGEVVRRLLGKLCISIDGGGFEANELFDGWI